MREQRVRDLGDREHENEVEEQFDIGDAVMAVRVFLAQKRAWRAHGREPVLSALLRHARLQRQRMQHAAHLTLQ